MDELASKIRFTPIYLYIIQGDISNTHSSLWDSLTCVWNCMCYYNDPIVGCRRIINWRRWIINWRPSR